MKLFVKITQSFSSSSSCSSPSYSTTLYTHIVKLPANYESKQNHNNLSDSFIVWVKVHNWRDIKYLQYTSQFHLVFTTENIIKNNGNDSWVECSLVRHSMLTVFGLQSQDAWSIILSSHIQVAVYRPTASADVIIIFRPLSRPWNVSSDVTIAIHIRPFHSIMWFKWLQISWNRWHVNYLSI